MKRIALTDIVFDAGTQIRAAIDAHVVSEYAEAMTEGATFPPIVVFADGCSRPKGGVLYYLADGFHRVTAAQRNQFKDIDADVRAGTKEDALWFALGANKANGKRLTEDDKTHACKLAFQTWRSRSAGQVAEQVGCSQVFASRIREQVKTSYDLPDRVDGKDGKSYPASRSKAASQTSAAVEEPPEPVPARQKLGPPSNGLQFARIAIMKLEEIRDNDAQRQQAFALVRRWLDAHAA